MSQSEDRESEDQQDQGTPAAAGPATNRRTVVLVSVIAVVVLVVAGVVIYALTSGDDADQAETGRDVPTITGPSSPSQEAPREESPSVIAPPASGAASGEIDAAGSVAEQAAAAISSADVTTLTQLSCDPSAVVPEDTFPADAKAEVVGEPQISGDTATVDLKLTIGGSEPATVPMPLVKQDGRWCVPS